MENKKMYETRRLQFSERRRFLFDNTVANYCLTNEPVHKEMFSELLKSGIKGVDRIVPVGKTMDFDLIWDGYNLPSLLTRNIAIK